MVFMLRKRSLVVWHCQGQQLSVSKVREGGVSGPSLILRLETTKAVTSLPYAIFIIIRQICLAVFSLSRL